jgi:hypothetical protein
MARSSALLALAAAGAVAAAHAPGTPNAARAAAGADVVRARRVDELPHEALYPRDAHARTRAAHRRIMSAWRAPALSAGSPVISPVTYGADPTGRTDSTAAFQAAMAAVLASNTSGHHMSDGIVDLGGVVLDLGGGDYLLSAPLVVPPFYGNLRVIDGTLRASASFDPARYVIEIGTAKCNTPSGQGSCNENVGMSGLTVDGSHVAAGCVLIQSTMGATLDASSAIFGFNVAGITMAGGHEAMVSETWVAAYFWSDPKKERNDATGILINGNDHYVSNTIVFSARVGVQLNGAANILNGACVVDSKAGQRAAWGAESWDERDSQLKTLSPWASHSPFLPVLLSNLPLILQACTRGTAPPATAASASSTPCHRTASTGAY